MSRRSLSDALVSLIGDFFDAQRRQADKTLAARFVAQNLRVSGMCRRFKGAFQNNSIILDSDNRVFRRVFWVTCNLRNGSFEYWFYSTVVLVLSIFRFQSISYHFKSIHTYSCLFHDYFIVISQIFHTHFMTVSLPFYIHFIAISQPFHCHFIAIS